MAYTLDEPFVSLCIDYDETFAPVANIRSIRCVLSIAAIKEWLLYQLFVKNSFSLR